MRNPRSCKFNWEHLLAWPFAQRAKGHIHCTKAASRVVATCRGEEALRPDRYPGAGYSSVYKRPASRKGLGYRDTDSGAPPQVSDHDSVGVCSKTRRVGAESLYQATRRNMAGIERQ